MQAVSYILGLGHYDQVCLAGQTDSVKIDSVHGNTELHSWSAALRPGQRQSGLAHERRLPAWRTQSFLGLGREGPLRWP